MRFDTAAGPGPQSPAICGTAVCDITNGNSLAAMFLYVKKTYLFICFSSLQASGWGASLLQVFPEGTGASPGSLRMT